MMYIQNTNGEYFMMWYRGSPVWVEDRRDAKRFDSVDDTAQDEAKFEDKRIPVWIVP